LPRLKLVVDISNWLGNYVTIGNESESASVSNPQITAAYDAASRLSGEDAATAWQNLTTTLVKDAWTVPVVRYQTAWVTDKKVADIQIKPLTGLLDFTKLHPAVT
jgi:hypothetical protein